MGLMTNESKQWCRAVHMVCGSSVKDPRCSLSVSCVMILKRYEMFIMWCRKNRWTWQWVYGRGMQIYTCHVRGMMGIIGFNWLFRWGMTTKSYLRGFSIEKCKELLNFGFNDGQLWSFHGCFLVVLCNNLVTESLNDNSLFDLVTLKFGGKPINR